MAFTFATEASSPLQRAAAHSPPLEVVTSAASSSPPSNLSYNGHPQPPISVNTNVFEGAASTSAASPYLFALDPSPPITNFANTNFHVDLTVATPDPHGLEHSVPSFPNPSHSPFTHHPPPSIPPPPQAVEPMNPAVPVPAPAISMQYMLFKHGPPPPTTLPLPRIHRLIPAAGPTYGGIEVTVLGENFHPSMQLNCVFGSTPSMVTQRWSDNTLVCILPPSVSPGQVHVWFEGLPKDPESEDGTPPCLFTYTDETDRALMKLALQVVGWKMTGKIEDAKHIALWIVGVTGGSGPEPALELHPGMCAGGAMHRSTGMHLLLARAADDDSDFETVLLGLLSKDVPTAPATTRTETRSESISISISKRTAGGQTLLHLAALAGFPALVRFLLVAHWGVDVRVDARDNNGCTALFLAALAGSAECARALVGAGAALGAANAAGATPVDVGPAGFFDFVAPRDEHGGPAFGGGARDEDLDEAAWGDAEDESDGEVERRTTLKLRRRRARRLGWTVGKPRGGGACTAAAPEVPEPSPEPDHKLFAAAVEKKAVKVGFPVAAADDSEKETATFVDVLYRMLAELRAPQGTVIPNMSSMIAGMQTRDPALPLIPSVLPVLVPIPYLQWGDHRARGGVDRDEKDGAEHWGPQAKSDSELANAVDFNLKSFHREKRVQPWTTAYIDAGLENPPTAYTTPATGPVNATLDSDPDVEAPIPDLKSEAQSQPQSQSQPEAGAGTRWVPLSLAPRQAGYDEGGLPAEEVRPYMYRYRPTHKAPRWARKKHDRMLVLFWIPVLTISFAWAFVHALNVALRREAATRRALVATRIEAGLGEYTE